MGQEEKETCFHKPIPTTLSMNQRSLHIHEKDEKEYNGLTMKVRSRDQVRSRDIQAEKRVQYRERENWVQYNKPALPCLTVFAFLFFFFLSDLSACFCFSF